MDLNAVFPTQPLEDTPFPARRPGCSHQSEFTRPYPNFPILIPQGTPSFPPVLSQTIGPQVCTNRYGVSEPRVAANAEAVQRQKKNNEKD